MEKPEGFSEEVWRTFSVFKKMTRIQLEGNTLQENHLQLKKK